MDVILAVDRLLLCRKGFRMNSAAVARLRRVCHALLGSNAPEQLAVGLSIGMVLGLVPKDNVVALSLCVLLVSMRCNKGIGLLAAIVFSLASPLMDNFAHRLGSSVLGIKSLQPIYASIFNLPFGPWLGFNNTVVTGSLIIGLYLAYP